TIRYDIGDGLFNINVPAEGTVMSFSVDNVLANGNISVSGGDVAFNTVSDQRLKDNIVDTELGLEDLKQIRIKDFTWIADTSGRIVHGLIAQELYEIYPQAVTQPV